MLVGGPTIQNVTATSDSFGLFSGPDTLHDCTVVTAGNSPSMKATLLDSDREVVDQLESAQVLKETPNEIVFSGVSRHMRLNLRIPVDEATTTWHLRQTKARDRVGVEVDLIGAGDVNPAGSAPAGAQTAGD